MGEINKDVAERIIRHLIDISNNKLAISEIDVIEERDEGIQEILLGLKHLNEDLIYNKEKTIKATEQIKTKNAQLSDKNEELEHFAYIVSHDLKAPLLALHSLASFIEEDLSKGKVEDVLSHLDLLKTRIVRMEKLIEGILNFSKIGMTKTEKTSIDLNLLAEETFDSIGTKTNFSFNINNSLPTVFGVRALFIQLFSNIISNAIKFNDKENGSLNIAYNELENHHQLVFKDNGPGIPQKYQEKIFGVLQTLDNSNSIRNTGIGLAIVKKIVTSLEGTVHVKSEIGKSASFIIDLPKHTLQN